MEPSQLPKEYTLECETGNYTVEEMLMPSYQSPVYTFTIEPKEEQ